jgi:hypothetical protein
VIRKMGPPDMIRQRPEWLYCTEARCASEFMYGHSLPPEWWVVGFDAQGRVIWKEALQSP